MAKATGEGGGTEATTLIFPKKSVWEELAEAKRTASKRSKSANGTYSSTLTRLVDDEHMDRRAARMVLAIDAIEDDSDLHITIFHLIDGLKKLGVLKRAMAQEDMFDDRKIDTAAVAAASVKAAKGASKKNGKDADAAKPTSAGATVHPIGDAARKVAEQAGGQQA